MSTPEQEAFVNLVRAGNEKLFEVSVLLKKHGLSEPQYNVLRILRGAGKEGLSCREVSERMITRLPDITRLLDRLEGQGYVARQRLEEDRRVIRVTIKAKGLRLLSRLDEPVISLHKKQFERLTKAEIRQLARLLEKARTD